MKKLYFTLILILPVLALAQEKLSYRTNGKDIEFDISNNEFFITYRNQSNKRNLLSKFNKDKFIEITKNSAIITDDYLY